MIKQRKIELLAPAKNLECGIEAINHGADAVYIGAPKFGARAAAVNSLEDIEALVKHAHLYNARIYVTVNTILKEEELQETEEMIHALYRIGVDALIVQDMGITQLNLPPIPLHASTQMDNRTPEKVKFLKEAGFRQVVLARELSLREIKKIHDTCPEVPLEVFVHGALCVSYSGQCYVSQACFGRSANRGECAQPCRWKYYLVEENRPGQYMPIGENEDGSYILNANDLCTAPFLDLICKAGVDSLKIEGRAKTFYYVASVTAAYRKALDQYLANPASDTFDLPDSVLDELNRTSHRHYSPGFYFGKEKALQTPSHTYVRDWDFIGTVDSWEDGVAHCTQRSKFCLGDSLEILQPDGSVVPVTPEWIKNAEGEAVDATPHPMMQYTIPCATPLMPYSLLRMQKRQ